MLLRFICILLICWLKKGFEVLSLNVALGVTGRCEIVSSSTRVSRSGLLS